MSFSFLLLLWLAAYSSAAEPDWNALLAGPSFSLTKTQEGSPVPQEGCFYDGSSGRPLTSANGWSRLTSADVLYLGEKHDDASHHRAQASALSRRDGAAAGFEMLYASHQGALDRYTSGTSSEETFLKEVDWEHTWSFPFPLYRPVFEALRSGDRAGLALNLPRALVHKIALSGLSSLSPEERAALPSGMKRPEDPAYLKMLKDTFQQHGGDPADEASFGDYLDAMTAWNEGMAARVAERRRGSPGPIVVVAGAFHAFRAALPSGVSRRLSGSIRQTSTILLETPSCPAALAPEDLKLDADLYWRPPL